MAKSVDYWSGPLKSKYPFRLSLSKALYEHMAHDARFKPYRAESIGICLGSTPFALILSKGLSKAVPWLRQAQPERMG